MQVDLRVPGSGKYHPESNSEDAHEAAQAEVR